MGITVDLILCLLAVFIIILHTVRGFVRSVLGSLKLIFATLFTFIFTPLIFGSADGNFFALSYVLVFLISYILLTVAVFVIDKIFELPVLNVANKILGFALGIFCAYITLSVASSVASVIFGFFGEQLLGQTAEQIIESSYIYRFFINFGVFSLIG